MTLEEAQKVAAILATADGGCIYCVGALVELAANDFPEFDWRHDEEADVVMVTEKVMA